MTCEQVREAAAAIIDARCADVLAKQTNEKPGSIGDSVNINIRMCAVLLPELAAAIRAMPLPEAPKDEREALRNVILDSWAGNDGMNLSALTDAILAAGWRMSKALAEEVKP